MKLKPIQSQVVVIVGAASGIGRETALQFADRGARLVVLDNDEVGLRSLVTEIQRQGGSIASMVGDVTDYGDVQALARQAVDTYGQLDTWVHCAAVELWATFQDTTVDEFRRVLDVNLMGQVHGVKAALPHLIDQGGALILVSSVEARRALPYQSAYAASKHGMSGFIESLRLELRHQGAPVSLTEIMPSSINTPLFDKASTKIGVKPTGIPPLYDPSVVTGAILYAAENPVRELVAGGAGKTMLFAKRISPRLMDAMLTRTGFRGQRTDEPKAAKAPSNLFAPTGTNHSVEGNLGGHRSLATWLDTHPQIKMLATMGVGLGVGALLSQHSRNG